MTQKNLPILALKKIFKTAGASRISDDALHIFRTKLEDEIQTIAQQAKIYARHAGRKTILEDDVALALKFSK